MSCEAKDHPHQSPLWNGKSKIIEICEPMRKLWGSGRNKKVKKKKSLLKWIKNYSKKQDKLQLVFPSLVIKFGFLVCMLGLCHTPEFMLLHFLGMQSKPPFMFNLAVLFSSDHTRAHTHQYILAPSAFRRGSLFSTTAQTPHGRHLDRRATSSVKSIV